MKKKNKKSSYLGDIRLDRRYKMIFEAALKQPLMSLSGIFFKCWHLIIAVYRFFANEKVTYDKMMALEYENTLCNIRNFDDQKVIFIIQDTTHLNYENHKKKKELFPTHRHVKRGMKVHPSILCSLEGTILGVLHATIWTGKKEKEQLSASQLKSRPIEKKESYRWIVSFRESIKLAEMFPEKTFYLIADREADIYELLHEVANKSPDNLFLIVRSSANRRTATKGENIREIMTNAKAIAENSFKHKGRIVKQIIKAKKVKLLAPKSKTHLGEVKVWVIKAEEKNPPKGKKPISWTILTSSPIKSPADAIKILEYYTARWNIEIFFKVLKSGCKVEKIRLEKLDRLLPCIAFYMSVAARIMFLSKIEKICPDLSADVIFSPFEWKAVYMAVYDRKLPPKPPLASLIIRGIAILGGYINRKNDPPPGPTAMWTGIGIMHSIALGFKLSESRPRICSRCNNAI